MMKRWVACLVVIGLILTGTTVSAQDSAQYTRKMRFPALLYGGAILTVIGFAMMLPYGDEYQVVGQTYCVSDNLRSVTTGGCGSNEIGLGLKLMGIGVGVAVLGATLKHDVRIAPTRTGYGAQATVRW